MDFTFGFQQNTSFDISDFTTNCNSFQEQDDQQHFLPMLHSFHLQENIVSAKLKNQPTKQKFLHLFSFT